MAKILRAIFIILSIALKAAPFILTALGSMGVLSQITWLITEYRRKRYEPDFE